MADKLIKAIRKNLFVIITLVLSCGILLYFMFTTDGIVALGEIVLKLKPQWLILAIAGAGLCWVFEGFVLNLLCKHLYPKWNLGRSFTVGMIGLLYSAVTPFSTGGQPMQIYTMRKMGMDTGKAGSIIAVKTLTYQIVMVLYSLVLVAMKLHFFQTSVSNFSFVTIIGLITNSTFITLVVLFMISETTTDKIVTAVIRFLHKIKLCRHPKERYDRIHNQLEIFHDATKLMGNSTRLYVVVMAVTVVQITLNSLIPYFIYRSFNMHTAPVTTMVAAQVFVAMVSAFVPLPGASGGAEGSFFIFFGMFFKSAIIPAILLWRIITYYFNILFGGICAYVGGKIYNEPMIDEQPK
nr:lysylphosphatidylglycerol synthase transmembrane domain-containing protein [uncultured Caproiciproducens sp.]